MSKMHDNWTVGARPGLDCTGDMLNDLIQEHALELVDRYKRDPHDEYERNTLVYMNGEHSIKVVCSPEWHPSEGEIYSISVFTREPTSAVGFGR